MEHHMEIKCQFLSHNRPSDTHKIKVLLNSKLFSILVMSLCTLVLLSCNKDNCSIEETKGSIYGVVTDFATGSSVANAIVSLHPGGESTLTGHDGVYEFLGVEDGDYSISVSKAEYTNLIDDYVISVRNGRRMRHDMQIKKIPATIRITDVNGDDITTLDFGSSPSTTIKAFNIFNCGTMSINCSIVYSCNWIRYVSSLPSTIAPGLNVTVNLEIDRSKLAAGNNVTDLYVTSNNGSNVLEIRATGQETFPNVLTLQVTYIDGTITPWCNTFHARVTNEGNPAYHTRGFCFSSTNTNPTINDNCIDVSGTGLGDYSYTYWGFPSFTAKYYVRAWVMYGTENQIQYGNVQSFIYNNVL